MLVPLRDTKVSVVIPTKDDAVALERCLRALRRQTRPADEILVVDNASTDRSADAARRAGARVIRCETPGIPAAAAAGYDAASHGLILRLDADCIPGASWVERMVGAADRHPTAIAFVGAARFSDGPRRLRRPLAAAYLGAYAIVAGVALGHPPLFGSNLALRRAAWRAVRRDVHGGTSIHDDLDLAFHIGVRNPIVYVHGAAVGISMRPFADPRAFIRRIIRGASTVIVHWPADFPPVRWTKLVLTRALRRRAGRRSEPSSCSP
jgi:glycosyltransferase involved in cell wall biosynthesis